MNIDEVLQSIQDFRSQLSVWGVNTEMLWAIAGASFILFVLSLREVACWFFKVNSLRDEVRDLRKQMADLQKSLNSSLADKDEAAPLKPDELLRIAEGMRDSANAPKFRLDH